MKVAILGSRSISKFDHLDCVLPPDVDEIVSGGAKGADSIGEKFARENSIKLTVFFPDYKKYGRRAPIVRNKLIAEYADYAIILWDGVSKGAKSSIDLFEALGKQPFVVICNDEECNTSLK